MRIGIVNDVPLACEALRRALAQRAGLQVIWTAANGAEAVVACAHDKPDLILMDLIMPIMDGVEATRRIMRDTPCPILVVTASVGANAGRVFDAMGHGALDAVDTPVSKTGVEQITAGPLLAKIEIIGRLIADQAGKPVAGALGARSVRPKPGAHLVAIGASAGGPAAIATVLSALPANLNAAVLLVQHVDVQFAGGMADWLARTSPLPVRLAKDGDKPAVGTVLLAGTNDHLVLRAGMTLAYTPEPRAYVYRPSVDVLFESVQRYWPGAITGVLLTGMGRDGAVGLKALRNAGHHTIAQDQATSAVYGMPKAAARLNAAAQILPLPEIAPAIIRSLASTGQRT